MKQKKILVDITLDEVLNSNNYSLVTNSYDEYINDQIHSFRDKYQKNIEQSITIDLNTIDFGYAQANNLDETYEKSITVSNHTRGKIIICWNSNEDAPFSIFPLCCEIPPLKTYSFRVKFSPVSNLKSLLYFQIFAKKNFYSIEFLNTASS